MRIQVRCLLRRGAMLTALAGMLAGTAGLATAQPVATTTINPALIVWHPLVQNYESITLRVSTPDGEVISHDFVGNQPVTLSAPSDDGTYTYELRVTPVIDAGVKRSLAAARAQGNDEAVARDFRKRKLIPSSELTQSGGFTVVGGKLIVPSEEK
ncbi:MAG: hypothetical protein HOP18_25530 [Deltaproteobacteria bacterium]|nr:hypothetical protein [Deltaproteobacteria bacterium]